MADDFEEVRKKAVEIALIEAKKDTKEVGAKNRGGQIDVYLRNANALKKDAANDKAGLGWCGMFIYYCYSQASNQAGKVLPFKSGNLWSGYHFRNWSLVYPDKIVTTCPVLPGDIYVLNNDHIGMVIEPVNDFNVVKTIDGNQGDIDDGRNSVRKRIRSFYDMRLLIRI